ncbi:ATP-grasp domain-containing protein [Hydrogenivirga sp. 128-5-R1-1]|uniref:D-alanine--D-alanine ligase family protein n=1 Tax=Hydrogenivirga sp. 128-5-R1-1 TaxID=392423 RepID=UPI00015EFD07|nr:ATP-grasp domain-containing protein [Hydrogenivirga sp. 128-5-R1-1]EDP74499.1 hypothetical protein HG1285_01523 [Hydrogenivirga sp. 128-5-R1-1]
MNVAVVYNEDFTKVFSLRNRPARERYERKVVEKIAKVVSSRGHRVEVFDANLELCEKLLNFVEECKVDNVIVFNLSYGTQGESRYSHVPAMLEMLGIMYTGSGPFGHAIALDKVSTKLVFKEYGIPTPEFVVISPYQKIPEGLSFPLVVKPRMEAQSLGVNLVRNYRELEDTLTHVWEEFGQEALVEEFIRGPEYEVSLIGNGKYIKALPITGIYLGDDPEAIYSREAKLKYHPEQFCPAAIKGELARRLVELSIKAFNALHLRDYARFDLRLGEDGKPYFFEVNSMASLNPSGSFFCAAKAAGLSYDQLIFKILHSSLRRYGVDVRL